MMLLTVSTELLLSLVLGTQMWHQASEEEGERGGHRDWGMKGRQHHCFSQVSHKHWMEAYLARWEPLFSFSGKGNWSSQRSVKKIKIWSLPWKRPQFNRGDRHGGHDLWPEKRGYKVFKVCGRKCNYLKKEGLPLGSICKLGEVKPDSDIWQWYLTLFHENIICILIPPVSMWEESSPWRFICVILDKWLHTCKP